MDIKTFDEKLNGITGALSHLKYDDAVIGITTVPVKPFTLGNGKTIDQIYASYAIFNSRNCDAGFGYTMHINKSDAESAYSKIIEILKNKTKIISEFLEIKCEHSEKNKLAFRAASNTVSMAAWDITGNQLNEPCSSLWGGTTKELICYDSYTLAFASDDEIAEAANKCKESGIGKAKILVGQSDLDSDIARTNTVAKILGPGNLAVDAIFSWNSDEANYFISNIDTDLMWVEDPVPNKLIPSLKAKHPIAGGERCGSIEELADLARKGITSILIDPGMMGGPTHQIKASIILQEQGLKIGFHAYSDHLAHIAAIIDEPLPVEIQDWAYPLFRDRKNLVNRNKIYISGSGFGVIPDLESIALNNIISTTLN